MSKLNALTPHRDAADAPVAQLRLHYATMADGDPVRQANIAMTVAVADAITFGFADLKDLGKTTDLAVGRAGRSMGNALAGLLLSVTGGNRDLACQLLNIVAEDVWDHARKRISTADIVAVTDVAKTVQSQGRA